MSNDSACKRLRYIIEHVFLPAKLPNQADPNSALNDAALLEEVSNAATQFKDVVCESAEVTDKHTQAWEIMCRMFKAMQAIASTGALAKSALEDALHAMKVGDVLPICVPSQNAGIIFRKRSTEDLTFESFEVSLPNEIVTGTNGKVVVQYPINCRLVLSITDSLLSTLANTISFLGSQSMDDVINVLGHKNFKEKVKDPASPRYITEALAGFLRGVGPDSNSSGGGNGTIFIQKRIGDHALCGVGKSQPWRRSSMWLLIRVSLQTTLEELGITGAKGYKAFQAYFLAYLLEKWMANIDLGIVPDDVIDAMNRKLARRMWKMRDLVDAEKHPTLAFSSTVIANVAAALNARWKQTRNRCVNAAQWTAPTPQDVEDSMELSFQVNQEYLRSVVERTEKLANTASQYDDAATTIRLSRRSERLDISSPDLPTNINTADLDTALIDFESWVEKRLPEWTESSHPKDCRPLFSILESYMQLSLKHYAQSPERISICWLTIAELWVSLDRLVVRWSPLMAKYSPEIPEDILDPLLLPLASHLKRMGRVQSYIRGRLAEPSGFSLFGDINSEKSFQNAYFNQSQHLQDVKRDIENWGLKEEARIIGQMEHANEKYVDRMAQAGGIFCEYHLVTSRYGDDEQKHSDTCRKCALESEASAMQIPRFEKPLPADPFHANALVFELNCPEPFGLWREATQKILPHVVSHYATSDEELHTLVEYTPKKFYVSRERRITIASPVATLATQPCHLPATLETVILPHSGPYHLTYNGSRPETGGVGDLRRHCTLQLDEPYKSLIAFIQNTTHTPNNVIASQFECPPSINLAEYMAFGHLRSGNKIQIRNVIRALISDSLSLNAPGIHSLIMQTIWQAGPNKLAHQNGIGNKFSMEMPKETHTEAWYRESHQDLSDETFAMEMSDVLDQSLKKVGNSGQGVFHLATLVALATRLLSLSAKPRVKEGCSSFLRLARERASNWMTLVESEINANTSDDSGRLQQKMTLIAVVWRLTFDVGPDADPAELKTLYESANLTTFLFAKMVIAIDGTPPSSLSSAAQLLLRRDNHLSHRLEPYIASELMRTRDPLDGAVQRLWKSYRPGLKWRRLPSNGWWKQVPSRSKEDHIACLNILSGEMLVNGRTPDRLPPAYVAHDAYQELFGKSVALRSYPSKIYGMDYEITYKGIQLHFAMIDFSLVIRVRRNDGVTEEYIPKNKIQGDIPSMLLHRHSHWYIEEKGRKSIEFRPLEAAWKTDLRPEIWILDFNRIAASELRGQLWKHSPLGKQIELDPHSRAFKYIHSAVNGVEQSPLDIIAVVIEKAPGSRSLNVTLVNHNLEFFINEHAVLESRSFPGYILDVNQDIGCLYGLLHRIVLCDNTLSQQARKVVVPRGRIEAVNLLSSHPTVHVNASNSTGFYVYDVDTLVGRLVGSGTMESNLFLLQLHAFTASHYPDPLTKRTGTEEALLILESASLLSHTVLSEPGRIMLEEIAAISPRRSYYPHWSTSMEQTDWNTSLPVASQHPGFERQVTSILAYWSDIKVHKLAIDYSLPPLKSASRTELSHRAAMRDLRPTHSHSSLRTQGGKDQMYISGDLIGFQAREHSAYQLAFCAYNSTATLPIVGALKDVLSDPGKFEPTQSWDWKDFPQWFPGKISSLWPTLYKLCCRVHRDRDQKSPLYNTAMTFAMLSYKGSLPPSVLGALIAIIRDPEFQYREFDHHLNSGIDLNLGVGFNEVRLHDLLKSREVGFRFSEESKANSDPVIYNDCVTQEVEHAVAEIKLRWLDIPNRHLAIKLSPTPRLRGLNMLVQETIQPLFQNWVRNKAFLDHLDVVSKRILQFNNRSHEVVLPAAQLPRQVLPRNIKARLHMEDVTLDSLMRRQGVKVNDITRIMVNMPTFGKGQSIPIQNDRLSKLRSLVEGLSSTLHAEIEVLYQKGLLESIKASTSEPPHPLEVEMPSAETLSSLLKDQEHNHRVIDGQILELLLPATPAEKLLVESGLWPRVTTAALLERLSLQQRRDTPKSWIEVMSHYANSIISVQRSRRLLRYGLLRMYAEYNREILHGRERESSCDPDWLLAEIEADLCIRSDQVEIAKAMISPPEGRNSVMQLNMGEGKSSVIVPIAAATLADTTRLVRVVILKPQSKLQLSLLRSRLSRLANRRVIYLPFDRDIKSGVVEVMRVFSILKRCRADGGIWLCQPEHLLSFKLLGLDLAMGTLESSKIGAEIIRCQLWMEKNTRDILDESDEILHTRRQLIYTMGTQATFDAAPMRWEVVQEILVLLHTQLAHHPNQHFLVRSLSPSPGHFPKIQMLSEEGKLVFHEIAWRIVFQAAIGSIRMVNFPSRLKKAAMRLLTQRNLPKDLSNIHSLRQYCEPSLWQGLLIVRGLIAFDVLTLCFRNKRWRVDYGHDIHDLHRPKLAVPYIAKDSPSPRSHFAHPDVLVVLTCLTYYYSGLDDSMMLSTVEALRKLDSPELIYEQWIENYKDIPEGSPKLSDVDLNDKTTVLRLLGPSLRRNKQAIDFFLNQRVFPNEAKYFPLKMSASGWDLAMEKPNPTTGFSGTNDSRFLLPTSIYQRDLPTQQHTNATVLSHLLRNENAHVVRYAASFSSGEILDMIFQLEPRITVLLDVGAQILDCSNTKLVELWLSKHKEDPKIKAAVFFDVDDNMCMMEQDGSIQFFADSPYSSRLDECLVYLDDSHTRGTDLKLPKCRAAVTLGPRISKDKLVQGCMRMRRLGSQHSLVFLAPDEVIDEIKTVNKDKDVMVASSHVLKWAITETCRQLNIDIANWAIQGYEFAARQAGWSQLEREMKTTKEMKDTFCQTSRTLNQLYGIDDGSSIREPVGYTQLKLDEGGIVEAIENHCKLFKLFSLDDARCKEEQEVELVHEQKAEKKVKRPPSAKPARHHLHPDVRRFVKTGKVEPRSEGFRTVGQALAHAPLRLPSGCNAVFGDIMVTNDFCYTIPPVDGQPPTDLGEFLRPVEWVVTSTIRASGAPSLVVFSPFEADELLSDIREYKRVRLHLFSPRTSFAMRSLEDLVNFTLPSIPLPEPQLDRLARQLNLFSGALYLKDVKSYKELCKLLRVCFGEAPVDPAAINSNGFVKDSRLWEELDLDGKGFTEDPVPFLRALFHMRRHGRSFRPSHMGQILYGVGLRDSSFREANDIAATHFP